MVSKRWNGSFYWKDNKLFLKLGICLSDLNYKFTRLYEIYIVLVVSVMTRLIEFLFKNLINVSSRLRSENYTGMLTCFFSSMDCTNCFVQSETAFSKKRITKWVILGTTYNHILHKGVLEVIKFTFQTSLIQS